MSEDIPVAVRLALYDKSEEDMSIYAQASIDAKGVRTERTPWQDGWNEACISYTKKKIKFTDWYRSLPVEIKDQIGELLVADQLDLSDREPIEMWVNLNDVFCYAADAEKVTMEEIPAIYNAFKKHGWEGIVAYFSIKLNASAIKGLAKSEKLKTAIDDLKREIK